MVVQNDAAQQSAHRRHSHAIALLIDQVRVLEKKVTTIGEALIRIEEQLKSPVEATAIRFDLKLVLALCALCASIVGGQKWSTGGLQEQMTRQSARIDVIDVKMDAVKQHEVDVKQLQDERASRVQDELSRIGGQAAMIDTKLSNLMMNRK